MHAGRQRRWRLAGSFVLLTLPATAAVRAEDPTPAAGDAGNILVLGRADVLTLPTSTGSRLGLTPLETPASIAVVDGDEIRARGDLSVVDAVTRAPGITSVANPGNGYTALAARGFSGQGSVLQLVDGIRLFPVAGTITFPTDPWNIDRIEVLSGPSSVLYGQGALGGAINILTKKPSSDRTGLDGELSYGSQNTVHAAVGAGGPIAPKLSYRIDGSYRRSDGFVDRGRSRSYALAAALRFEASDTLAFTLRDDYGDQRPTRYFGTPLIGGRLDSSIRHRNYNVADADVHFRDNRTTLTVDWEIAPNLSFTNAAYRLTSKRLFKDLESYCWVAADGFCPNGYNGDPEPPGRIYRTDNLGIIHDQTQYGDQGSFTLKTPLGGTISNDLVVGFDVNSIRLIYFSDFGSDTQIDTVDPRNFDPGLFFDTQGIAPRYRTRTTEYSIYGEDRLKLGPQLSLVGGIRAERDRVARYTFVYDADGTVTEVPALNGGLSANKRLHDVTWRVGGVYQPIPTLSLYAQYATGVDPVGTLTTFSTNAVQYLASNAHGDQVELGMKASFLDGHGSATLAAYRIVKHDLTAQRRPNGNVDQIGQRSAKGIEASLSLDAIAGFGIEANGTVLRARYDDFDDFTGNTPPNIPETTANLWLRWNGFDRLRARAGLRYVGHTYSDDANIFRVPGYTVVDADLSYGITRQIALDIHLTNLFDKDYAVTTYNDEQWILGRPRSIDVAIRARF